MLKIVEYYTESLKTEKMDYDAVRAVLADDQAIRFVHAALGLGSEFGELIALNPTVADVKTHIAEELGDLLWFSVLAADAINKMRDCQLSNPWVFLMPTRCDGNPLEQMSTQIEAIQSAAKAMVFYGRTPDWNRMMTGVSVIVDAANKIANREGFTQRDIMDMNRKKLRSRYKAGKFTRDEANNRDTDAELRIMREGGDGHG